MKGEQIIFDGKDVVLREIEVGDPREDEIILRAEWSQVSMGTERAYIEMAREKGCEAELGYSFVGTVEKKGPKAKIEEGERVLGVWCPHASIVKARDTSSFIVKVPEGLSSDIATVGILGSVAFHIVERANIRIGESVGVFGQGVVGSLTMQIAKMSGALPIVAIDIDEKKLQIAREYGADHRLNPERENIIEAISKLTGGEMLNVAIEATGRAGPVRCATDCLGQGGRLVLSSFTYETVSFSLHGDIVDKELMIIGAHQPDCPVEQVPYYPFSQVKNRILTMELLKEGRLKIEKLISHRIKKEKAPDIYSRLLGGEKDIMGVLIDWR